MYMEFKEETERAQTAMGFRAMDKEEGEERIQSGRVRFRMGEGAGRRDSAGSGRVAMGQSSGGGGRRSRTRGVHLSSPTGSKTRGVHKML